jgi:hypothetical protein
MVLDAASFWQLRIAENANSPTTNFKCNFLNLLFNASKSILNFEVGRNPHFTAAVRLGYS